MNAWLAVGLGVVVALDLVLAWLVAGPAIRRRRDDRAARRRRGGADEAVLDLRSIAALDPASALVDGVPATRYDPVVRVAGWAYLLSTAAVVYATGQWPAAESPLLLILAIGGIFLLLAHDVLPTAGLGPRRFVVEVVVAITLVSLVVVLTGGAASPFFYAYPLVVAGSALVVRPRVAIALSAVAVAAYLAAVAVAAGGTPLETGLAAIVLVNLVALLLLAYVAMVVAREQRRTRDAAIRLSTIDALTGLANRAFFLAAVEREIDRAARYGRGFCVLMADLDGLKDLNDTFGHRTGDRALSGLAAVISESVRRIDLAARLGGDEFVVLLPETDREGARVVADKIREGVAATGLPVQGATIPVSVSIGVGEWWSGQSVDDVMAAADDAMYEAKRAGARGRPRAGATGASAFAPGRFPAGGAPPATRAPMGPGRVADVAGERAEHLVRR